MNYSPRTGQPAQVQDLAGTRKHKVNVPRRSKSEKVSTMSENSIPEGRDYMQSRRQNILEIQDRIERAEAQGDDNAVDEIREELDQMPLSVEIVRHVEIFLGVGGPTDWLDVELHKGGGVRSVTYFYAWGGESFKTTLSESDALYQYAENVAEYATEAE